MNTGAFGLFTPFLGLVSGGPDDILVLSDVNDEWFSVGDESQPTNNQNATIDGTPVTVTSITEAAGPQLITALVNGLTVNLSLTPVRIVVNGTPYIMYPGLPPDAQILIGLTVPLFPISNAMLPLCLAGETLVATAEGPRQAADIRVGDRVVTEDGTLQPVLWVGRSEVDFKAQPSMETHRPILFHPGAIDTTTPQRALRLSPQHRVLIRDWRAELYFGEDKVLVPAKSMVNGTTIVVDEACASIVYVHVLLPTHQVLWAEGAAVESLLLGDVAAGTAAGKELADLFPDLARRARMEAAAPALRMREARII